MRLRRRPSQYLGRDGLHRTGAALILRRRQVAQSISQGARGGCCLHIIVRGAGRDRAGNATKLCKLATEIDAECEIRLKGRRSRSRKPCHCLNCRQWMRRRGNKPRPAYSSYSHSTSPRSIARPATPPPTAPMTVPSVLDPPGAITLPSAPPARAPMMVPVVPSSRLQ